MDHRKFAWSCWRCQGVLIACDRQKGASKSYSKPRQEPTAGISTHIYGRGCPPNNLHFRLAAKMPWLHHVSPEDCTSSAARASQCSTAPLTWRWMLHLLRSGGGPPRVCPLQTHQQIRHKQLAEWSTKTKTNTTPRNTHTLSLSHTHTLTHTLRDSHPHPHPLPHPQPHPHARTHARTHRTHARTARTHTHTGNVQAWQQCRHPLKRWRTPWDKARVTLGHDSSIWRTNITWCTNPCLKNKSFFC